MKVLPFILFFFCSCQSATKLTYKAIKKDKATVAAITRELFPCGIIARDTTFVIDTVKDFVECPESTVLTIHKTDTTIDTVVIKKTVKVPVMKPQRTVYITQRFEDSAKIYVMQNAINLQAVTIGKIKHASHIKNVVILWLLIIIAFSILAYTLLKKVK